MDRLPYRNHHPRPTGRDLAIALILGTVMFALVSTAFIWIYFG